MARLCAHCGTEVDDDALFCPTCGEPIERGAAPDLPPAPDWPEPPPEPPSRAAASDAAPETMADDHGDPPEPDVAPIEPQPEPPQAAPHPEPEGVPPWRRGAAYRASTPAPQAAPGPLPVATPQGALRPPGLITPPETLSGWLVGIGAAVGVVAMLLPWVAGGPYTGGWGLASGINLLVTLLLLGVLVVVFTPHLVPAVPERSLVLLAIGLIGVGIGLDRLALPLTGVGAMIFLIGMLALVAGAFLAQLGLDRSVGGPGPDRQP